ncbi:MAG: hypothetical protein AAF390_18885 [Pseudomonadota bacterium]
MTIIPLPVPPGRHRSLIEAAIDAHGPWAVLRAALAAFLRAGTPRPPRRRHRAGRMPANAHLRRDLGLPPLPDRVLGPFG